MRAAAKGHAKVPCGCRRSLKMIGKRHVRWAFLLARCCSFVSGIFALFEMEIIIVVLHVCIELRLWHVSYSRVINVIRMLYECSLNLIIYHTV